MPITQEEEEIIRKKVKEQQATKRFVLTDMETCGLELIELAKTSEIKVPAKEIAVICTRQAKRLLSEASMLKKLDMV